MAWMLAARSSAGTRPSRNSPRSIRDACRSTLFDPNNGISQAAFNYIKQDTFWTLTQKLDNIGGSISGGLFGLGLPAGEITGRAFGGNALAHL